MERSKHIFIIIVIFLPLSLIGQKKEAIYQAYVSGNMTRWQSIVEQLDQQKPTSNQEKLNALNYQYGYIAWCISQEKKDEAKHYLRAAYKTIRNLEKKKYNLSMLYAYKAAFIGFEIGLNPYKAPFIGPQSIEFAKRAKVLDTNNAMAYVQLGNIAYYTPKIFGGDKTLALKHYQRAIQLFETSPTNTINDWNYLNLLVSIIEAYIGIEDYNTAEELCKKALKVEPNFEWVAHNLYPQVKEKQQRHE